MWLVLNFCRQTDALAFHLGGQWMYLVGFPQFRSLEAQYIYIYLYEKKNPLLTSFQVSDYTNLAVIAVLRLYSHWHDHQLPYPSERFQPKRKENWAPAWRMPRWELPLQMQVKYSKLELFKGKSCFSNSLFLYRMLHGDLIWFWSVLGRYIVLVGC